MAPAFHNFRLPDVTDSALQNRVKIFQHPIGLQEWKAGIPTFKNRSIKFPIFLKQESQQCQHFFHYNAVLPHQLPNPDGKVIRLKERGKARIRGTWNQVFGNSHPLEIEVGMGKGRFIMEKASASPDIRPP